jgi:Carboxypeptidase regulatory-like domain
MLMGQLRAMFVVVVVCVVLCPAVARAQATLAGVVRDPSGAVLPGVNVEVSSDALIDRVRTTVTDGSGQWRIVDLRPGIYVLKFSLAGFNQFVRELFNSNTATAYDGNYDAVPAAGLGPGGEWLRPTSIVQPRFVRLNVTMSF